MPKTDDTRVFPCSNLKPLDDIDEDFPDKYKLELYRLHTKLRHLECAIKDKDNRLVKALGTLDDELMFWRTGLHQHVWESMGEMNKRMIRISVTIEHIKDIHPHVVAPMELPAKWIKK